MRSEERRQQSCSAMAVRVSRDSGRTWGAEIHYTLGAARCEVAAGVERMSNALGDGNDSDGDGGTAGVPVAV